MMCSGTDHNESIKIYAKDILLLLEQSGFDLYMDLWAENDLYFGNKGKQVLDIDKLFGSDKFGLKPSLGHLAESAARVLNAPIIAADFNHKEFLRTATDVIAIEKSLSARMKAKWLGTPGSPTP